MKTDVEFETLTAITTKQIAFWNTVSCRLVGINEPSGRACCVCPADRSITSQRRNVLLK